jgi:hypothetical protein
VRRNKGCGMGITKLHRCTTKNYREKGKPSDCERSKHEGNCMRQTK